MMESLFDTLLSTPQREKAGSLAQERFDFQAHWGVAHLLDLHEQDIDYAIAFEFHDDIFVIKYSSGEPKVSFYQVKTKETGSWDIKEITKQPKGKSGLKPSIIGKLLSNKQKFPDHTDHLGFVSNAPASFIDKVYPCKFSEADKGSYTYLMAALKNEFPGSATNDDCKLFHFYRTQFTLEGYETYIRGRVSEFIFKVCGPVESGHEAFRLTLLDQCRQRAKRLKDVSTFSELLTAKFIRRSDLEGWLENLEAANLRRPSWDNAQTFLHPISAKSLRDIRQQWEQYQADTFKIADVGLHQLRGIIRSSIDEYLQDHTAAEVRELVFEVAKIVMTKSYKSFPYLNDDYVRAGVLYEFQSS